MSDIDSYMAKMHAREDWVTTKEQLDIDDARMKNAIRNTVELLQKPLTMPMLVNYLYKLYLQGQEDARKVRLKMKNVSDW